jgi:hypothetical protein
MIPRSHYFKRNIVILDHAIKTFCPLMGAAQVNVSSPRFADFLASSGVAYLSVTIRDLPTFVVTARYGFSGFLES